MARLNRPRCRSLRAGAILLATCSPALAAEPAPAPPPASETKDEQPIVITGSRIPRLNLTAVSPVAVVNSEDIKLGGVTNAEELLNHLPMFNADQGVFISALATGTATLDLRGLGNTRTLVLLNGRRMLPGDPGEIAPDINAIPSTLIKRIEVLTGGASSVYGSDAVAGVVNFILDTRLNGVRIDAQASFFQHENDIGSPYRDALVAGGIPFSRGNTVDGGRQDINAAFGTGFLKGRGHVTVYAGYRKLSKVSLDARDYSACGLGLAEDNSLECSGSGVAYPGNFFTNFDVFQIGPDRTFTPGFRGYNFAPANYFQRPDRRYVAGGFVDLELSNAIKPFVEVMYMNDRSVSQGAPGGNFGSRSINCDNALLSDQQRAQVCFTGNFVGEVPIFDNAGNLVGISGSPTIFTDPITGSSYRKGFLIIRRRNVEGGPRRDDLRHDNLRLLGGVKGDVARGLSYEASYLYGRVKMSDEYTGELSRTRILRSLDVITDPSTGLPACRSALTGADENCVPWDIFALGGVTGEATDYLDLSARIDGSVKERIGTAFVTAQLGEWGIRSPWADEGPALNAGGEYRKDVIDYEPNDVYQSGDVAGHIPLTPYSGSLRVEELFAEARIPLIDGRIVESVALEAGYRRSWYRNTENSFTSSAYKLGVDVVPMRGVRLRGSQQRAVRAPNIADLYAPNFSGQFGTDPCAGIAPPASPEACALTGVSAAQYGHILAIPNENFGYNALFGGNPLLEPETATTRTLGLVAEPRFLPGFNATVDWWDIKLKGAISGTDPQTIIDTCIATGDPFFCNRVHRDSEGSLWLSDEGHVDARNGNIGVVKVRGIDVGVSYSRSIGRIGSVALNFLGSHLKKYVVDDGGLSTPRDCAGLYGFPCDEPFPRWKHKARLTWESGSAPSLSLQWRYVGKLKLASVELAPELPFYSGDAAIAGQSYFDFTGLFRVGANYLLRLGVNNIFDRHPPVIAEVSPSSCTGHCQANTYTQHYDPLGRYLFAGVTLNLN